MAVKRSVKEILKRADVLRFKSDFKEAFLLYMQAKHTAEAKSDIDSVLDATLGAAHCARLIGDFLQSIYLYQTALDITEAEDLMILKADCLTGLALSLKGLCKWEEALEALRPAQSIYKKEKDTEGLAYSIWAEGAIWRVAGDIKASIKCYKKALRLFEDQGFSTGVAYSLCGIGGSTRIAGDYKESLKFYTEANRIFKNLKDHFGKAYSHCGIGNAFRMLREVKDAETHFNRASELYASIEDVVSYSYTLWSLATLYKLLGQLGRAKELLSKAEANFQKTHDQRGIAYCSMTHAEIGFLEGKKKEALKAIKGCIIHTEKHSLQLEYLHSKLLKDMMKGSDLTPYKHAYSEIGVTLRDPSIPFNIP